jgi:hypothetical protein
MKMPRFDAVRMVEWDGGFGLLPFYRAAVQYRIELCRVVTKPRGLLGRFFGRGRECWAVQVWETVAKRETKKPALVTVMDPEATEVEAQREYESLKDFYGNPDGWEAIAACIRSATPHPS